MNYSKLLADLEGKRQVIMKRIKISLLISAVIILLSFIFTQFQAGAEQIIIFGIIISVIISLGITFDAVNKYKKLFKEGLMPLIIEKVGTNIKYEYKSGISESQAMHAKLFKRPDRYHAEDLLYGEFEGVNFYASDVTMQERHVTHDNKGNRRVTYETYFSGRWFVYDFNKQFNGIIQVREDGFLAGPMWGLNIEKIKLEDVEFNKKFKTYATNQHDAFYVLTPSLMVNIKELERRYPGRIYFSFIGSELHIAIYNSKNSFEPPVFSPINDEFVELQVRDIKIIQEIVLELKLNRKIFKQ